MRKVEEDGAWQPQPRGGQIQLLAAHSYAAFVPGIGVFAIAQSLQSAFVGFVPGRIGFLWPARSTRDEPHAGLSPL